MKINIKTVTIAALVVAVGFPAYFVIGDTLRASNLRLNLSKSVPVGMYYRTTSTARYAAICLSMEQLAPAVAAGIDLRPGECPNTGLQPILKPVYEATMDNPIKLAAEGFYVDGKLLPNTAPKKVSLAGKPLTHYDFGRYHYGYWAISDFSPDSFDSRYFGVVAPQQIAFYAKPVFTANWR
jgi:conjugative transfer signal peptidase TraF